MKSVIKIVVIGFFAGLGGSYTGYQYFIKPNLPAEENDHFSNVKFESPTSGNFSSGSFSAGASNSAAAVDFSEAASRATPSVVYINSISEGVSQSPWDWFFGEGVGRQTQV